MSRSQPQSGVAISFSLAKPQARSQLHFSRSRPLGRPSRVATPTPCRDLPSGPITLIRSRPQNGVATSVPNRPSRDVNSMSQPLSNLTKKIRSRPQNGVATPISYRPSRDLKSYVATPFLPNQNKRGRDLKTRSRHQFHNVLQRHQNPRSPSLRPTATQPGRDATSWSRPQTAQSNLCQVATPKGCHDVNPSSPGRDAKTMSRPRPVWPQSRARCLGCGRAGHVVRAAAHTVASTLHAWRPACMDKNFGFFGRYFAEISFFGEPRKEKYTEISFVRFFPKISDFFRFFPIISYLRLFPIFLRNFRFFHSFFLLLFCFKNLKKLFLVGFEPTQNAWKWHTPTTKPLIPFIIYSANFFYIILLFIFS